MRMKEGKDAHSTFFLASKHRFWTVSLGEGLEKPVYDGVAARIDRVEPGSRGTGEDRRALTVALPS